MPEEKKQQEEKIKVVPPHKIMSREIVYGDIKRVVEGAKKMFSLLDKHGNFIDPIGNYKTCYAIAHCQITKDDPLRFFMINPKYSVFNNFPEAVIVNPKIVNHTRHTVDKEEGCLSYATLPPIKVQRWNKCEVEFNVITKDMQISPVYKMNLSGTLAQVFQHECLHFEGRYIYNIK